MPVTVTQVEVEADDDALVVRWDLDGDGAVDIAAGPTPDAVDHTHALEAPAGTRSIRLTGLGPGRHYVSVAPHGGGGALVAAERRVRLEGAQNFRDLGGYATATGARVRWGQVFRADGLHRLTAADLDALDTLGLRVVFDLRRDEERETDPDALESRQLSLLSGLPSTIEEGGLLGAVDAAGGEAFLHRTYLGMLANAAPSFGELLAGLAEPDGMPAVFHCFAGKDRTGLTAALLLSALAVGRDTVLDDYELTARWWTLEQDADFFDWNRERGIAPEAAIGMLGAPRWAMADTLTTLDAEYGGAVAYLLGPAGLDQATLDELRRLLLQT